jgi:DNA-binding MarR family transcriptional regulator
MLQVDVTSEELLKGTIDRFWESFPPLWSTIRAHIRESATARFNITVEQFHILRHIRRGKGCVSELAEIQNISRPAISRAVDMMVAKGWISRKEKAGDRRYTHLELTEEGNALLDAIFGDTRRWMAKKMDRLTSEELAELIRAMETLKKISQEMNA